MGQISSDVKLTTVLLFRTIRAVYFVYIIALCITTTQMWFTSLVTNSAKPYLLRQVIPKVEKSSVTFTDCHYVWRPSRWRRCMKCVCLSSWKGDSEVLGADITSAGRRLGGQAAGYPTVSALQQHPFPSSFPSSQVQGEVIRGRMASSLCHYPPITCHPLWADNRTLPFPQLHTSFRSFWTVTPRLFLNPTMPLWFEQLLTLICPQFTLFLLFFNLWSTLKNPEDSFWHILSDLYLIWIILRHPLWPI